MEDHWLRKPVRVEDLPSIDRLAAFRKEKAQINVLLVEDVAVLEIDRLAAFRVEEAQMNVLPDVYDLRLLLKSQGKPLGRYNSEIPIKDELIGRIHTPPFVV
jgi:hypothetical protein